MDIPVYLVAGFLDAGKTNFINGILEDGFAREDKTLLLCCEEGEEEYEKKALDNVTVVTVDDEDELTADFCRELEKKYRPKQVLIEYNGMWQMEKLYRDVLPANWVLYQIMTFVQAPTFELFVKNMGQLMMEKITNADMLVFNRCTPELKEALRARNLRMVNRRADIYLEDNDGNSEDYLTGNECPFDMTPDLIDIPDDDYGVWYVDVMDHLRPLCDDLLRKRHPVRRRSRQRQGPQGVQEPRLGGGHRHRPQGVYRGVSGRRPRAVCGQDHHLRQARAGGRFVLRAKRKPCGAWLPRQTKSSRLLQGGGFSRFILPPEREQ